MTETYLALLSVFAVILLGAGLKRAKIPGDAFWPMIDRLTYPVGAIPGPADHQHRLRRLSRHQRCPDGGSSQRRHP